MSIKPKGSISRIFPGNRVQQIQITKPQVSPPQFIYLGRIPKPNSDQGSGRPQHVGVGGDDYPQLCKPSDVKGVAPQATLTVLSSWPGENDHCSPSMIIK